MPIVDGVEVAEDPNAVNTTEQQAVPPADNQETQVDAAAGGSTEQTASFEVAAPENEGEVLAAGGEDDEDDEDEEEEFDEDEQLSAEGTINTPANNAELALAAMFKAIVGYAATNGLGFIDLADAETRYFAEKITVALAEFNAAQTLLAVPAEHVDVNDAVEADEDADLSTDDEKQFVIEAGNKEADPMSGSVVLTGEVKSEEIVLQAATEEEAAPKAAAEEVQPAVTEEEVAPKAAAEEVKSAVTEEEVAPQAATEEVKPAVTEEEVAPQAATEEEVAPQAATEEEVAPQAATEEVKPAVTEEEVAPKAATEEVQPTVTEEEVAPKVATEEEVQDAAPKSPVMTFSSAGSAAASGDLSAALTPEPVEEVDQDLIAAAALAAAQNPQPGSPTLKGPGI